MEAHLNKILGEGLTYDDVLLVPAFSEVLPRDVNIQTKFTRNITINIPIVSAAMDTVTESKMAIAMAREGGIGVLHKNMSIADQAVKIRKVKRAESGMILDPVTLPKDALVKDAKANMREHSIGGIPIVDQDQKLIGIVTNRDLRFEKNNERPISEVMTYKNLVTVAEGTSLDQAEDILQANKIEKLPVINKDNKLVGLITFRDITKLTQKPIANKDQYGRLRVAAAIGVTADALERTAALVKSGVDAVVIDTAHGHSKGVIKVLKEVKAKFPSLDVIVGNIATGDAAKYLVEAGADAVKVGIGPGSICTTRIIAGVGFPQFSAVLEVAAAIKGSGVPVIADGGIRYTGDIPKALAAGADTVMLGSLLAGTKESPGETIIYEGRKFKSYRGMGSVEAMKQGSKDRYFQDVEDDIKKLVPEGIVGRVPYKGDLFESIHQFVGGLRAGMGYCGAKDIAALQDKGKFVKITSSGITESHPHHVTITKESPNYSR
ncbi:IMP dehydrogenase [Muriicola soli]|uniref:Inosine-5'-monophosphate dehydrogenase n=1 Tax=Muriicola soli TaxID=2507538 RepID=A0A411EAV3_9FLAO|nr:IMP dehydrogenase [Muriicola soli]QBA64663.1 IMP dehydrogenase [Muriicola soli]